LQTRLDSTSVIWLQLRTILLINEGLPSDAIAYSHLWQQQCQPQSRQWAIMAYYRSVIYGNMGNIDQQRYWLAQSALIDIRHAIMDQGALWSLAETLTTQDTDLDRAHRYIDFSWQCLVRFSSHMRSWLVAPIVTNINDEYKRQLQTANHRHISTIVLISFLTVGLLILLAYIQKKRRQLASARNDLATLNSQLSAMNSELSSANTALSQTNEQLRHAIIHLNDSNRVKDEYLGKFLSICSEYIDKLDNYRLKINRKLKANQHGDLLRMTGSDQLKADELKELFQHFDTLFLHLFPTFVADFNALLRPEERIEPAGQGQLSTDLRIFALIRLGIDESSKIAEFLHYSPNSIYAYRARIKNKAAGRRDDFERQVKEIGIYG
jgi:type II secretory pathway pseudopilin PulG